RVGVLVIHHEQAAMIAEQRQREVMHAVVIETDLQRLLGSAVRGVFGKRARATQQRRAPRREYLIRIAFRHDDDVLVARQDFLKSECVLLRMARMLRWMFARMSGLRGSTERRAREEARRCKRGAAFQYGAAAQALGNHFIDMWISWLVRADV